MNSNCRTSATSDSSVTPSAASRRRSSSVMLRNCARAARARWSTLAVAGIGAHSTTRRGENSRRHPGADSADGREGVAPRGSSRRAQKPEPPGLPRGKTGRLRFGGSGGLLRPTRNTPPTIDLSLLLAFATTREPGCGAAGGRRERRARRRRHEAWSDRRDCQQSQRRGERHRPLAARGPRRVRAQADEVRRRRAEKT